LNRARCYTSFFAAGVGIGAWGGRLPVLLRTMSIDEAQLGQILFGFASGAIALVMIAGQLIDRFPRGAIGLAGSIAFGASLIAMPLSSSFGQLASVVVARVFLSAGALTKFSRCSRFALTPEFSKMNFEVTYLSPRSELQHEIFQPLRSDRRRR